MGKKSHKVIVIPGLDPGSPPISHKTTDPGFNPGMTAVVI